MLAEGRSVHPLDGFAEFIEPHFDVGALVAEHEGLIDAGERLVLRVFQ